MKRFFYETNSIWRRLTSRFRLATKQDVERLGAMMNAVIAKFRDEVTAQFTEIGASADQLVASVNGVAGDVQSLKKKIDDLQNAPGALGPEDQAALDEIQALANNVASKTKSAADQAKALDEATEPAEVPVLPPNA